MKVNLNFIKDLKNAKLEDDEEDVDKLEEEDENQENFFNENDKSLTFLFDNLNDNNLTIEFEGYEESINEINVTCKNMKHKCSQCIIPYKQHYSV